MATTTTPLPGGVRTFSAYAAAGISGLVALAALNLLADHTDWPGLDALRNYVTRRNG